jgi:hypothetical protein
VGTTYEAGTLFVGIAGFVSKLCVDRDEREHYRGPCEWYVPPGCSSMGNCSGGYSSWSVPQVRSVTESSPAFIAMTCWVIPELLDGVDPEGLTAWSRIVGAKL